jgi:hypothetical protein
MQRGLVAEQAMDEGGAVALAGEAQPVEPSRPSHAEVPLDADLVRTLPFPWHGSNPGLVRGAPARS